MKPFRRAQELDANDSARYSGGLRGQSPRERPRDRSGGKITNLTDASFDEHVKASDVPVLVDFWAEWCGPCRMLGPIVEKVATAYAEKVKVVKLNTDENPALGGEYHVSGIPCLILFKGGKPVDRIVGYVPEGTISTMLGKHVA